jgi:hypothetical protein
MNPGEFNVLLNFERELGAVQSSDLLETLTSSPDPARQLLALRIENLGVLEWDLWATGAENAEDVDATQPRALVMDLGGFDNPEEPLVAALSMLDHLWAHRYERQPVLVVIDEAHNLCPPDPVTPLERALTARIVQIAAEGRKFGLWLLLSTQRPSKIHPNALSQCDNLALLRMSSPHDLADLGACSATRHRTSSDGRRSSARARASSPAVSSRSRRSCRWAVASRVRGAGTCRYRCHEPWSQRSAPRHLDRPGWAGSCVLPTLVVGDVRMSGGIRTGRVRPAEPRVG